MVKVDIKFTVKFKLVLYSKEYDNGKIAFADIEEVLKYGNYQNIYKFDNTWYKTVTLKNYDEKYIRRRYHLEDLFERIEHSKDVEDLRKEIIRDLLNDNDFAVCIGEKKGKPTTLFGFKIFKGSNYNHLKIDFEYYITDKMHKIKPIRYGGWDVIPKVVDYELEYK